MHFRSVFTGYSSDRNIFQPDPNHARVYNYYLAVNQFSVVVQDEKKEERLTGAES